MAILLQCCKVYYTETVSLDEALESGIKRVKVITKDNKEFVFDSIHYVHDKLYGQLHNIKGENIAEKGEITINKENIREIHLYNKRKSRGKTTLAILGGIAGGAALVLIISSLIVINL